MSPTGYTAPVQDGKVTEFRDFALRCARNFGALIMMRDDPMDAPIRRREPSGYHIGAIARAKERLAELQEMTPEDARQAARDEREEAVRRRKEMIQRRHADRVRYEAMLDKVRAWEPPTADHVGLKEFMEKQLVQSIDHDCDTTYLPDLPDTLDWRAKAIAKCREDIEYHQREHAKDLERCRESNEWIDALVESLL